MARKILLADDSVTAQNMGRKILADAGYEVLTVNNGSAALKKIAEMKPELIVLDVYMPGYSGLEVCQRLKEAQETARIPVLLTVGKLEPFKPEEAKRVRADGYIVKPFEASELLSALSKLEDKIVPRQEPSKPGRFARANAAIDGYDKTVAPEEDAGWKNRIAFPSKKKKSAEDEPANDNEIYNAVNKDLRTRVEQKPAPESERVSVAALVPEGLPKDVTPEEIAALAAAAAQVQGKISEAQAKESQPQESHPEAAHAGLTLVSSTPAEKPSDFRTPEVSEPVASSSAAIEAAAASTQPVAEKPEEKITTAPDAVADATKTEPTLEEKRLDHQKEDQRPEEPRPNVDSIPAPSAADVNAALATLEPASPEPAASPFSSVSRDSAEEPAPATMAAAAGAHFAPAASRWTAVSVALAPDETAISLEHEMQKAHAAFAAAEAVHTASPVISAAIAEPVAVPFSDFLAAEPKQNAAPELSSPAPTAEPELSQPAGAVESATTESITGTVRDFEAVGSAFHGDRSTSQPPEAAATAALIPSPETQPAEITAQAETAASSVNAASEGSFAAATTAEPSGPHFAEATSTVQKPEEANLQEPKFEEPKYEAAKSEESKYEAPSYGAKAPEPDQLPAVESHEIPVPAASVAPEPESLTHPSLLTASSVAEEHAAVEIPAAETSAEHHAAPAKSQSESEIAATTAAAWASWRRIRESSDGKPTASDREEAAMAVAAGAEKSPEGALSGEDSAEESGDISSIVDSVLADLRPKIVAEISRKLGKKK